jgi:4-carboxymuconolactone decarboxylase
MSEERKKGLDVVRSMLGEEVASSLEASVGSRNFGAYRGEMAVDFVFGKLWSREGLDRKSRSLVTLGILIALGQSDELKIHLLTAIRNGCSVGEVEEVLYHSAAYAGFPLANQATHVAEKVFREHGLID